MITNFGFLLTCLFSMWHPTPARSANFSWGVINKECELPVIPVVDAAARDHASTLPWFLSACSLSSAALLMIAGPLVTDWQPWAGCTRSHLTGRSLSTSSCSSPLHPPGSTHPTKFTQWPAGSHKSHSPGTGLGAAKLHMFPATMAGGKQYRATNSHLDGGWGWVIVGCCFMVTVCTRAVTR